MGNHKGGCSYVDSRCLDKDGYDNECYVAYRGVCDE